MLFIQLTYPKEFVRTGLVREGIWSGLAYWKVLYFGPGKDRSLGREQETTLKEARLANLWLIVFLVGSFVVGSLWQAVL